MSNIPRLTKYSNAASIKLRNRRVTVIFNYNEHGDRVIEFRTVMEENEPLAFHNRLKDKVTVTSLMLSREACHALRLALSKVDEMEEE